MIIEYNLTSLCTNMHVIPAFCRGMEGWNSEPVKCAFRSNSKFWKFYLKKSQITLWQSFFPIYSKHMDSNFQCIHAVLTDALQQLFEEIRNMYTLFVQSMVNKDLHFSGHKSIK